MVVYAWVLDCWLGPMFVRLKTLKPIVTQRNLLRSSRQSSACEIRKRVNSIRKENQSQMLLLQHAAYHQINGLFDFPCLKVDSESLILNTY
jgi:hypothetical protein